ncbi:hypothetical protein QFZ31_001849 [Neobacillus niacini]|nr:hypothetical protein [Neobacillus niacini]
MSVLRNLPPMVSSLCKTPYILLILITVSNSIFEKIIYFKYANVKYYYGNIF